MNVIENVLRPGDSEFDAERSGFQTAHPHRPALIVGATGVEDVRAAVTYAAERELPIAVQLSGHGQGAPLTDGVLISTRRMNGVAIDPVARTARIEAGVRWQQVVDAAAEHGLAPISGSSPEVGAVGYTLGGGLGVLGREFGWAADHVRSIDLVTADGKLRHVTAESDPELFGVLCGAGGGLGVVTAMEIGLVPVSRVYGGGLYVDAEHVPALLAAYREWTADLPEELTSSVGLIPFPDLPMVPDLLRGRYVAHVRIAYNGPTSQGERLVAPLRSTVPLLRDTLGELPFTASHSIYNDPTQPHPYAGTNALLRELDPTLPTTVLDLVGPDAPVPCVVQIRHLGGALARPSAQGNSAEPSAVGHRDAAYLLHVLSVVDDTDAVPQACRRLMDAAAPWTVGRTPNFLYGAPFLAEREAAFPLDVQRRRAALLADLDPKGLFQK